jgi:endonuclease/exonuclease/phosphatase (EEP) superfamily protein YafD
LAAVATAAFSLLTLLGVWHRLLELFSHFRVQYGAVAALLAVIFLLFRDRNWTLAMLAIAAVNAAFVVPWYLSADYDAGGDASRLTILHANVYGGNDDYQRLVDLLGVEQPDIVFVQELSAGMRDALQAVHSDYPFRETIVRDDFFGIGVYSRLPLDQVLVHESAPFSVPSLVVTARLASGSVTLLSTHPPNPVGFENFVARNQQLQEIGNLALTLPPPIVLIGDLNTSMWAYHYRLLIRQTGLRNARKGFGVLPSWPAQLPFARIPIDHCLVSPGIEVVDIRNGPAIGSDHLPLIVTLRVAAN